MYSRMIGCAVFDIQIKLETWFKYLFIFFISRFRTTFLQYSSEDGEASKGIEEEGHEEGEEEGQEEEGQEEEQEEEGQEEGEYY